MLLRMTQVKAGVHQLFPFTFCYWKLFNISYVFYSYLELAGNTEPELTMRLAQLLHDMITFGDLA